MRASHLSLIVALSLHTRTQSASARLERLDEDSDANGDASAGVRYVQGPEKGFLLQRF